MITISRSKTAFQKSPRRLRKESLISYQAEMNDSQAVFVKLRILSPTEIASMDQAVIIRLSPGRNQYEKNGRAKIASN